MREYSITTAISKIIGRGRIAEELRKIYHRTFTRKKLYRDILEGERILRKNKIQIKVISETCKIREVFGDLDDPKYKLVLGDELLEDLSNCWSFRVCSEYLDDRRLLAWAMVVCSGYLSQIREIFEERVYDVSGSHSIIFDVGANMGVYTIKNAVEENLKENEVMIYAVEPDPVVSQVLERNLKENRVEDRVKIIRKALWSSPGMLKFCRYSGAHPSNGVLALKKDHSDEFSDGKLTLKEVIEVSGDTLDNIVEELGIDKLDLIKMDVERSEVEIVKGGRNTLVKLRPKLAIAAYHRIPPTYERSYIILKPLLKKIKYRISLVQPKKFREAAEEIFIHAIPF